MLQLAAYVPSAVLTYVAPPEAEGRSHVDLEVSRSYDGAVALTTLAVTGRVDLDNGEALLDAGLTILWADSDLALDLSAVDLIDAAGVAALTALDSAAQRLGATFCITAVSCPVYRVLRAMELTERWSVPCPDPTR